MPVISAGEAKIDTVFTGPHQMYLVTRNGTGQLRAMVVDDFEPGDVHESVESAELPPACSGQAPLDFESVYLLAWQVPSVTATLTGFSEGVLVGSTVVEVKSDPTRVEVDWGMVDQLAISYTGAPGFPVMHNFFFL